MIQTRSEITGIAMHNTLADAYKHSQLDPTVWKISFQLGDERVRLVRTEDIPGSSFYYEPMLLDTVEW
jgi:hypothetical protein